MTTSQTMQRLKVGFWVVGGIITTVVVVSLVWSLLRPPVTDGPEPPDPWAKKGAPRDAGPG